MSRSRWRKSRDVRDTNSRGVLPYALAALPVVSFCLQWTFSASAGTLQPFRHHLIVVYVDWIFVPFNFLVASVIEWRRGVTLYAIATISIVLNVFTHAYWQIYRLDPGHMITGSGVMLPAGWVHLAFSVLQMVLLVAFVFCRRQDAPRLRLTTAVALAYFVLLAIGGYLIQHRFIASDLLASTVGVLAVLLAPFLQSRLRSAA